MPRCDIVTQFSGKNSTTDSRQYHVSEDKLHAPNTAAPSPLSPMKHRGPHLTELVSYKWHF